MKTSSLRTRDFEALPSDPRLILITLSSVRHFGCRLGVPSSFVGPLKLAPVGKLLAQYARPRPKLREKQARDNAHTTYMEQEHDSRSC